MYFIAQLLFNNLNSWARIRINIAIHTPITSENMIDGKTGLHYVYCSICFHSQQPATMLLPPVAIEVVYPCETIQVIEKVLSDEIH